jgi:hypothetical protein
MALSYEHAEEWYQNREYDTADEASRAVLTDILCATGLAPPHEPDYSRPTLTPRTAIEMFVFGRYRDHRDSECATCDEYRAGDADPTLAQTLDFFAHVMLSLGLDAQGVQSWKERSTSVAQWCLQHAGIYHTLLDLCEFDVIEYARRHANALL